MSESPWLDNGTLVQLIPLETDWSATLSNFLKTVEDGSSGQLLEEQEPHSRPKVPKELINTEARKLIRQEKFQQLGVKKNEIILSREIEHFREKLVLERNFARSQLESSAEAAALERKHRQIRAGFIRHIDDSNTNLKNVSRPLVKCERFRSTPNLKQNISEDIGMLESQAIPVSSLPQTKKEQIIKESPKDSLKEKEKALPETSTSKKKPLTPSSNEKRKTKTEYYKRLLDRKRKRYYWCKWKLYVASKRKEREEEKIWREKINDFMHRLNERPVKQKSINQNQESGDKKLARLRTAPTSRNVKEMVKKERRRTAPVKLLSQQSTEDKDLKDIEKAIAESRSYAKKQLANNVAPNIDRNLKGKAKLVRIIAVIPDTEERTRTQDGIQFPPPEIQIVMDRRHEERKKRLLQLQEMKRQSEEDMDRLMKERYEQQLLEEELEKKRKLREFREKLKKEKEEMERKKREWGKLKELNELAVWHYNQKLMTKYGFSPWLRLVERRRRKAIEAEEYNSRRLKRITFKAWLEAIRVINEEKEMKAIAYRTKYLVRTCFYDWILVCIKRYEQMQVAEDWYDYFLQKNSLQAWVEYVDIERRDLEKKWEQAAAYYEMKLVTKCLQHWMLLPQIMYLERQKEYRKKEWREKVQQVLPDFKPFIRSDIL